MIYFILDDATQNIKIGFTARDGEDRLRDLQTGCPGNLAVLLQIEGSRQDETQWHSRFAHARLRDDGEWFKPVPELMLAISGATVSQLQAENARLRTALEAEHERVSVARGQLGSLSVFAATTDKSIGVALRNISQMLEGSAVLPVQRAVIFPEPRAVIFGS